MVISRFVLPARFGHVGCDRFLPSYLRLLFLLRYPDILAIVDVVAAGIPGEPTAAEILAVQEPDHSPPHTLDDMNL